MEDNSQSAQPLVSVIIPVYNGEQFLEKTIESVLHQTYPALEIIAVNDGSTDGSQAILDRFCHRYPERIRAITVPNGGVSRARNIGVQEAKGELIAFIDQDDLWHEKKLELQVRSFTSAIGPDLLFTNMSVIDGNDRIITQKAFLLSEKNRGMVFDRLLFDNFIPLSSVMLKKSVFLGLGGFDPSFTLAEDYDLFLRYAQDRRIGFIDEPLLLYRVHGKSYTRTRIDRIMAESFTIQNRWIQQRPEIVRKNFRDYMNFRLKFYFLKIKCITGFQ